jgi:hypothetical protein
MHSIVAEEKGTTMGAKDSATKAGTAVDELDLGGARETPDQLVESARSHPARWAAPVGALVVAAATTVGVLKWLRDRRTPKGRAKRAWRSVSKRFG